MQVPLRSLLLLSCASVALAVSQSAAAQSIAVEPGFTTITVDQTLQYSAKVTGLTNTAVTWEVGNVVGGSATSGTISKTGLYKPPTNLVTGDKEFTITALGSDGKTKGSVNVMVQTIGPDITSAVPDPIAPGKFTVTLHGSGFQKGAVVRNGTQNMSTYFESASELVVSGTQATTQSAVFEVANPGSTWGPAFTVPFATSGPKPVITPSTIYVHLGAAQVFTSAGATYWTTTAGTISQTGLFVAPSTMPASNVVTVSATGPGGTVSAKITLAAGADQAISPKTASLNVKQTQQFTSTGGSGWKATYGTISSTGLYTAPSVWPASGTDQIYVNGPQGNATETITILPPTPTILTVGNHSHIPYGLFSVTVKGTNLSPGTGAELLGIPLTVSYTTGQLQVEGFLNYAGPATLKLFNKNQVSAPFPVQIGYAEATVSPAAARRFLEQAAFGPSPNDADTVQSLGYSGWLSAQFAMPQYSTYKNLNPTTGVMASQFVTNAVEEPDQLRQRVAFALSQIFVTSLQTISNQSMIDYQDMLLADAFTNYSQIMSDVTYSPAMGQYLNMGNNAKADTAAGSLPNENFAREMMQLFTIGTSMLNPDGTVQVDSNNVPLPTYPQSTIGEFARVYTGFTYAPAPGQAVEWNAPVSNYGPMVPYPAQHDPSSKQLLYGYVAPANTSPTEDVNNALSNIFHHPNVGPFVSTQLIQHLVKSNPSPAYVSRVAAVFNNNGSGVRGDMKAVITAILLDPEARANDDGGNDQPTDGHLQEPALFIAGMVRAFGGNMNDYNYYPWELSNLGQNLFSPDNVFNYYAPNYGIPGTHLMGGEFQINSPNDAVLRANEVSNLFNQYSGPVETFGPGTRVDLSPYINLASNPTSLVNALDITLTHGVMPAAMKQAVLAAVSAETGGNLRRVQVGAYLILTSSYYNVWH